MSGKGKPQVAVPTPPVAGKVGMTATPKGGGGGAGGGTPTTTTPTPGGPYVPGMPRPPKGHRQRGAGTVVVSKGDVTVAGITMKDWMKTPQTLLLEYTQHEKRPKPRYDPLRSEGDGIRYRVVLQDAKRPGTDKDLIFMPTRGFVDDAEAKHTVSLLALHALNGSLPLERKLPEPYRTLWLVLNGQNPDTNNNNNSDDDEEEEGGGGAEADGKAAKWKGKPKTVKGGAAATASAASSLATSTTTTTPTPSSSSSTDSKPSPLSASAAAISSASSASSANLTGPQKATPPSAPPVTTSTSSNTTFSNTTTSSSSSSSKATTTTTTNIPPTTIIATATPPPTTATAASNASNSFTAAPVPVPVPVKRPTHVIPYDVRLANKHLSAADQRREKLEKETRRAERKNKRAARLRELLSKQADAFIMMSSNTREYVQGVLKSLEDEARTGGHRFSRHYQHHQEEEGGGGGGGDAGDYDNEYDNDDDADGSDSGDELAELIETLQNETTVGRGKSISSATGTTTTLKAAVIAELVNKLQFQPDDASRGFQAGLVSSVADAAASAKTAGRHVDTIATSGLITVANVTSAALDWLCLHVPEDKLPAKFDPRGKVIEIRSAMAASSSSSSSSSTSGTTTTTVTGIGSSGSGNAHASAIKEAGGGASSSGASTTGNHHHHPIPAYQARFFSAGGGGKPEDAKQQSLSTTTGASSTHEMNAIAASLPTSVTEAIVAQLTASLGVHEDDIYIALNTVAPLLAPEIETSSTTNIESLVEVVRLAFLAKACRRFGVPASSSSSSSSSSSITSGFAPVHCFGGLPTSSVPSEDPILLASQELESSASIYSNEDDTESEFRVKILPVSTSLATSLLDVSAEEMASIMVSSSSTGGGGGSSSRNGLVELWAWVRVCIRLHSSAGSLAGSVLNMSYLTPLAGKVASFVRQKATTVATSTSSSKAASRTALIDYDVPLLQEEYSASLEPISAILPPSLQGKLYPNVLPLVWITDDRNTSTSTTSSSSSAPLLLLSQTRLTPAGRLNMSLNLYASLSESLYGHPLFSTSASSSTNVVVPNPAAPVLYELGSLCSLYGNETAKRLQIVPEVFLRDSSLLASRRGGGKKGRKGGNNTDEKKKKHNNNNNMNGPRMGPPRLSASQQAFMRSENAKWSAASEMKRNSDQAFQRMQTARGKLPIASFRQKVVELVNSNQVVLLSGETGCGKTTQVPQFILDDAIQRGKGGETRIVCTQPRRIAAIGVSQRVASERCEPLGSPGGAVGFQIRGEKKAHPGTTLLFTTTGVLLRRLTHGLGHVTHILVDEVHERGVDTDFLLAVLRRVLPHRPDVKLVLMSATMDAAAFATYFANLAVKSGVSVANGSNNNNSGAGAGAGAGGLERQKDGGRKYGAAVPSSSSSSSSSSSAVVVAAPALPVTNNWEDAAESASVVVQSASSGAGSGTSNTHNNTTNTKNHNGDNNNNDNASVPIISVPGFVHPIKEVYLEDVLRTIQYLPKLKGSRPSATTAKPATPTSAGNNTAAAAFAAADGFDEDDPENTNGSNRGGGGGGGGGGSSASEIISSLDLRGWKSHGLDYGLVASLIHYVCSPASPHANDDGSVLVFMPGSVEIRKLHREIEKMDRIGHMHILHLHGSLTADEQALVFKRPPGGKRKVVLATNVAETSITIDDITIVIDTFRVKEIQYDALNRMSKLVETWTSQAASKQRRGRAGRVRPGTCYRLVPIDMHAALSPQTTPEIQRTPLESLCLQVKLLRLGKVKEFMNSLLDPPPQQALKSAVKNLIEIGAMQHVKLADGTTDLELSPLGYHVALLPVDVRLAKSLIFGAMLKCIDPILTIAAALSEKSPFRPIVGSMDEDVKAQMEAARSAFAWGQSDHLAIVRAFDSWRNAGGMKEKRDFADSYFLSHETMRSISDLRAEYAGVLADVGFLPGKKLQRNSRQHGADADDGAEYSEDESTVMSGSGSGGGASTSGKSSNSSKTGPVSLVINTAPAGAAAASYGKFGEQAPSVNAMSQQINVIRAALVAGLFPHVVKVVAPERRYMDTMSGAIAADHKSKDLRFYTLQDEDDEEEKAGAGGGNKNGKNGGRNNHNKNQNNYNHNSSSGGKGGAGGKKGNNDNDDDGNDSDASGSSSDTDAEELASREVTWTDGRTTVSWHGFAQDRVWLHPSSFCFGIGEFRCPWLLFHEKVATTKVYIRDASVANPYAMILFGGPLTVHHRDAKLTVGSRNWVHFRAEPRIGVLAKGLRSAVSRLLADKIADPELDVTNHPAIEAVLRLLISNGN